MISSSDYCKKTHLDSSLIFSNENETNGDLNPSIEFKTNGIIKYNSEKIELENKLIINGNNEINNNNNDIETQTIPFKEDTPAVISSSPTKLEKKIIQLQKSTDTLVEDEDELAKKETTTALNDENDSSSSSSHPGQIFNMSDNEEQLKNVSTSTSGLSEYVYSTQIRAINDSIKKFEEIFKNHNNSNHNNNNNNEGRNNFDTSVVNIQNNYKYNLNAKIYLNQNGNNNNKSLNEPHDGYNNNNNAVNIINGKSTSSNSTLSNSSNTSRSSSSSCISSNCMSNNNNLNKKSINQLLDIDGLTTIDDSCSKRLIEREDDYKKEISQLKTQVQRCKTFLSSLTNNPFIFDSTNFDLNNDFDKRYEDNGRLLNNDSTCGSWDEVEEYEYRMITWVPDHLVTHCQYCNQKFGYAVRKHHCRFV